MGKTRKLKIRKRTLKRQIGGENKQELPRKIWCLWLGNVPMSENRLKGLVSIATVTGIPVQLVTDETLSKYIKPEHPLHKSYEFLSATHKADYIRIYLLHHYGGGYADLKTQTGSFLPAFEEMERDPNIWLNGYKEINEGGIATTGLTPERAKVLKENWAKNIGNGIYISRSYTPITTEILKRQEERLEKHYSALKLHPAKESRDGESGKQTEYPIQWNEILGSIVHDVCFNNLEHVRQSVPIPNLTNYK